MSIESRIASLTVEKKQEYDRVCAKIDALCAGKGDAAKLVYDEVYQFLLVWSGEMIDEKTQVAWTNLQLEKLNAGDNDYLFK
jgi:hypothetical protein